MDIKVDTITTSPTSLLLGCVVNGPEGSWMRFCKVEIPFETIPIESVREILLYGRPDKIIEADDLPLF